MDDAGGGFGWQAKQLNGKIFTVRYVDATKQIHLEETGIALIPGVDQYEIVKEKVWKDYNSIPTPAFQRERWDLYDEST